MQWWRTKAWDDQILERLETKKIRIEKGTPIRISLVAQNNEIIRRKDELETYITKEVETNTVKGFWSIICDSEGIII